MTPKPSSPRLGAALWRAAPLLALLGCEAEINGPAGPGSDGDAGVECASNRDFFAQRAWPEMFGKTCIACHAPDGVAVEGDAAFRLLPSNYPGFIEANMAAVAEMARNEYDGVPLLLAKPTGLAKHGGGTVIAEDDPAYALMQELVTRLRDGEPCVSTPREPDFGGVTLMSPTETFRKASLQLVGRLPTEAELAKLDEDGEEALVPLLDGLMKEPAFYERLKEMFNDVFLTDRYYPNDDAVNLLDDETYPRAGEWFDAQPEEVQRAINRALAREPLELLAYIVRTGKPFSELLTANYTVVNPYSAQLYGLELSFDDPTDEGEWKEAKVRVSYEGGRIGVPHSGVLTNPMWLNRFPSSETNRNRHRARMVMQQFLATDILKVAERPIDALNATKYNNPTRDDPSCTSCHRQLDPIAGAFMKWDDDDQEELIPDREWYRDMFAPGFGDELIPVDEFDTSERWLARRIVNDPRFALSTVRTMYTALTGHKPLEYPRQDESSYAARLAAWESQEIVFRTLSEELAANDFDLRVVIRGLVISPYFRAGNAAREIGDDDMLSFADMGTGRLTIPEVLDRKIAATVGIHWMRGWDRAPYLRSDYQILYGGIDSEDVTVRLTELNSVMSGVQWRMANEVACMATAFDFSLPKRERNLFKLVDLETTPIADDGSDDAEDIERIKKNIRALHERFWGTRPSLDDPELLATYQLFLETWREGLQGVASDTVSEWLPWQCQARDDLRTGEELSASRRIEQDPRYTVRAWMAVLTYLMADYQFLYE